MKEFTKSAKVVRTFLASSMIFLPMAYFCLGAFMPYRGCDVLAGAGGTMDWAMCGAGGTMDWVMCGAGGKMDWELCSGGADFALDVGSRSVSSSLKRSPDLSALSAFLLFASSSLAFHRTSNRLIFMQYIVNIYFKYVPLQVRCCTGRCRRRRSLPGLWTVSRRRCPASPCRCRSSR